MSSSRESARVANAQQTLDTYASVAVDDVWVLYAVQEGEPVAARRQPRDTHHSEIAVLNGVWPTHVSTCSLNLPGSPIEHAASFSHPDTEFITPYLVHPAVPNNPWPDQLVVDGKSPGNSKKAAAKIIKNKIEIAEANADGNSIHSYSDAHAGTLHSIPKVGLGYTVKYGRKTLANGSTSIGPRANIYDAEIKSDQIAEQVQASRIHLYCDKQAAVRSIIHSHRHPAQYASRIFHRHAHTFLSGHPNRQILVKWLPGHSNIQGNEQADEAAKGTNASKRASRSWKKIWDEHTASRPDSSAYIPRAPSFKLHPIFNNTTLSRNVQCRLVQFLTGHGLYGEYRGRFRPHLNSQCSCDETEQTPRHSLLFCPDTAEFRHILTSASPNRTGKELFGTLPGLEAVADFISKSGIRKLGDPPATAQNMQDLTSTSIRP
ncbi:Reverse transcriptase from mobile element jockey protein [Rhizoctonia solani]|uniref:Reverse transcriptase from mobile element jockey protein n=1 Tax=Rhizoctonia solani TaxID=456999 RepID=A0A8H8STN1_9AGAM|nr:Reverse transcriptase from mobile element jockey protein [Rhizoctonia solani]QRW18071.1 Reverse transcriptase from mobile element jockey protein [Rhizoctonia solani]